MLKSIATLTLSGTLREKLEAIAAAGFTGVEIVENDLLTFNGTPQDIRKITGDLGLNITLYQPFRDFEGMPQPDRYKIFDRVKQKFETMHHLGTDLLLVCSNVSVQSVGGTERAAEDFYYLGELAKTYSIRVGFEALAWGKHISHYRDAWKVVKLANHESIGIILDSFHILASRQELSTLLSIPAEKIFLVQLADAPFLHIDLLTLSRHFREFPGQGQLPLINFMSVLQATGYSGYYSLEIFNDHFKSAPATQTATDGFQSLLLLEKATARQRLPLPTPIEFDYSKVQYRYVNKSIGPLSS